MQRIAPPTELRCSAEARWDRASKDWAMTSSSGAKQTFKTGKSAFATTWCTSRSSLSPQNIENQD